MKQVGVSSVPDPATRDKTNIVFNLETGEVLHAKNPERLLPPASITKLGTAALYYHLKKSGFFSASETELTEIEDTLKQALSRSDNLAARSVGEFIMRQYSMHTESPDPDFTFRNKEDFERYEGLMDSLLGSLEMYHTHFTNPSGLSQVSQSYYSSGIRQSNRGTPAETPTTTASDLQKLMAYIIREHPEIVEITSQRTITLSDGSTRRNTNQLLSDGIRAPGPGKTGTSKSAGACLVASVEREINGETYKIGVITLGNTGSPYTTARELIEYTGQAIQQQANNTQSATIDDTAKPNPTSGALNL